MTTKGLDSTTHPAAGTEPGTDRRRFLSRLGKLAAGAAAAGAVTTGPAAQGLKDAAASDGSRWTDRERRYRALQVRVDAALQEFQLPHPPHPTNGDEERYRNRIGSFSKGLRHKANGEVQPSSYDSLLRAVEAGTFAAFERVELGGARKLVDPLAGRDFVLEGPDSHQLAILPAPAFASAEEAAEAVELYWQALLRDVPYTEWDSNPRALAAVAELDSLKDFTGPRIGGHVTPQTLFRLDFPGTLEGPYFSQFLWLPVPFGAEVIDRRILTAAPGVDFMTTFADWLAIQNGAFPTITVPIDSVRRFIRAGRDLGQLVHVDSSMYQEYLDACLILSSPVAESEQVQFPGPPFGLNIPFNEGNPYNRSRTQVGFATFGTVAAKTIMAEVTTRALKASWFQKWFVHRRLRPDEFGERVHKTLTGEIAYPIDDQVLDSEAVRRVFDRYGTFLLPQAFPEGSPVHPSYPEGHGVVAGACTTILKAVFDTSVVIPDPVMASPDGLALFPYSGPPLTVEGELNKLAMNVAIGRDFAGVHWRTDALWSILLGEEIAIGILRDQRLTYVEPFRGYTFRRFDGTTITV